MVGGVHYRNPGLWVKADDDARRPVGRPGLARHRRRLEQGGVRRARVPRSRRSASGSRCSRRRSRSPTACGRASAGRRKRPGPALHGDAAAQLAAVAVAAAAADHDRGRWRAEDAPARRPVRRRMQRLRRPDGDPPQVRGPPRALRRRRPRPRRDRALDAPGRQPRRDDSTGPASSTGSASSSDAGAQHVIFSVRDVHEPANLERDRPRRDLRNCGDL